MFWRWEYFQFSEVFKPEVNTKEVTFEVLRNIERTLDAITQVRICTGRPIIVNSFYRDSCHNKRVGGVDNSFHTKGLAIDVVFKNMGQEQIITYTKPFFNGIIFYPTFVHLDLRDGFYVSRR